MTPERKQIPPKAPMPRNTMAFIPPKRGDRGRKKKCLCCRSSPNPGKK
jgi:hypothetical protein